MCPPGVSQQQKESQRLETERLAMEKARNQRDLATEKAGRLADRNSNSAARIFSVAAAKSFAQTGAARSLYNPTRTP